MNVLRNIFGDGNNSEDRSHSKSNGASVVPESDKETLSTQRLNRSTTRGLNLSEQGSLQSISPAQTSRSATRKNQRATTFFARNVNQLAPLVIEKRVDNGNFSINSSPALPPYKLNQPSPQFEVRPFSEAMTGKESQESHSTPTAQKPQFVRRTNNRHSTLNPNMFEEKFEVSKLLKKMQRMNGASELAKYSSPIENLAITSSSDSSDESETSNSSIRKDAEMRPSTSNEVKSMDRQFTSRYPRAKSDAGIGPGDSESAQRRKTSDDLSYAKQKSAKFTSPSKNKDLLEDDIAIGENDKLPEDNNEENPNTPLSDEDNKYVEDIEYNKDIDENFRRFYSPQMTKRHPNLPFSKKHTFRLRNDPRNRHLKWLIYPDDPLKITWDVFMIIMLIYIAITLPLRLSFIDHDTGVGWVTIDWFTFVVFVLDIIINMLSVYYDGEDNLVTSRKKIVMHYMKSWFIVDFLAVIPLDRIINASGNSSNIAKLPRLYKLFKMAKLLRLIKIIREKGRIWKFVNDFLHLNTQMERLLMSLIVIIGFVHIWACLWKFILDLTIHNNRNWLKGHGFYSQEGVQIDSDFDIYIASCYLIIQTLVTVGYGDLTSYTTGERIISCFWMFVGVFLYSFTIGSLASLISDMDSQQARFNQKLNILISLKKDYKFTNRLYLRVKNALRQTQDNADFLNELPQNLRQEVKNLSLLSAHNIIKLSYIIHEDIVKAIPFFQDKPRSFIACIGPLLRPMKISKGEFIFMEGDPADEIFFVKTGRVAYVIPKYKNFKFLKIKEGYFFGETDLLFYGEVRKYTVMAIKHCELYVLNKKDFKQVFLMEFRDIGVELVENAYSRKNRTRKTYKEALSYLSKVDEMGATEQPVPLEKKLSIFKNRSLGEVSEESQEEGSEDSGDQSQDLIGKSLAPALIEKLDQIVENRTEDDTNLANPLTAAGFRRFSQFLTPSTLPGYGNLFESVDQRRSTSQKNSGLFADSLSKSAIKTSDKEQPKVTELTGKVDIIQERLNDLLSMSLKLQDSFKEAQQNTNFQGRHKSKSQTVNLKKPISAKGLRISKRRSFAVISNSPTPEGDNFGLFKRGLEDTRSKRPSLHHLSTTKSYSNSRPNNESNESLPDWDQLKIKAKNSIFRRVSIDPLGEENEEEWQDVDDEEKTPFAKPQK